MLSLRGDQQGKCCFQLYIMTLGCLAPYRRLGIGTKMLEHVLNVVRDDGNFTSIFLHVQINNESAIEFYKKFGFNIVETKEQYYKVRIDFPGNGSFSH